MTPWGTASYPHLLKADTFKNQTKFKTGVVVTNQADIGMFKDRFKELIADERFKFAKNSDRKGIPGMPFEDTDAGFLIKSSSKFKPAGFDSRNNPLPDGVNVGGGSTIRFLAQLFNYDEGISLQILSYQVRDLKEWGGASQFEPVDDGYTVDDMQDTSGPYASSGADLDI